MKAKKLTLNDLFLKIEKEYWSQERFLLSGHSKEVSANYRRYVEPQFGQKKVRKITRIDVIGWHSSLSKTPFAANRALEVLSTLFNRAIASEYFEGVNPCQFVKPFTEKKRKRYGTKIEIQKIGQILFREAQKPRLAVGSVFLLSLLFTGARPRSLERARHSDLEKSDDGFASLSFEGKSTHQTGEEEVVVFPPFILRLIEKLPRRRDGLIFGIKLPIKLWKRVQQEVGCLDLWARDLRRTFSTLGRSIDVNMDTISTLLNHQTVQTTKIYAKLYDEERILAAGAIADKMEELIFKKASG